MTKINKKFIPRGQAVSLTGGSLPEIISPYMQKLIALTGGIDGPLGRQFIARPDKESRFYKKGVFDPLIEEKYEVAPGLIYKYKGKVDSRGEVVYYGRALWTIARFCATYCRFCTRGREVGLSPTAGRHRKGSTIARRPFLSDAQIDKALAFLSKRAELNEVILSGGDPLVTDCDYLTKIINGLVRLQKESKITVVRIGTRLPVTNPLIVADWHYRLLAKIKNPYLMVHINHPAELTRQTVAVLDRFRKQSGVTVMSQSVLLKGVNDSVETLYRLFVKMTEEGIRPYYLYQNDPVYWAAHFTVPIKRAIKIWQQLRPRLSGIAATARFVVDTPFGHGKIPLPEGDAWQVDYRHFSDFKHQKHLLE